MPSWQRTVSARPEVRVALSFILVLVNFLVDIPAPKIQQLLEELKPVDNWYLFGVKLNVPVHELNKIKFSEAQGEIELYKTHTLQYWLNSNPNASWKDIVRALEQINNLLLASEVKAKYLLPKNAESE